MDTLMQSPITMCLSKVTLAEGTTSTLSTTGTTIYSILGVAYSKAALTNQATPTTDWATGNAFIPMPIPLTTTGLPPSVPGGAAGYACAFLIGFDTGGNLKAIQGPIVACDSSGAPLQAPSLPPTLGPVGSGSTNNDFCPIGYIVVKSGSTAVATFTFGTTSWTTTGYTTSLGDLVSLTGRPLDGLTYS